MKFLCNCAQQKLFSRKIWVAQNSSIFHTVWVGNTVLRLLLHEREKLCHASSRVLKFSVKKLKSGPSGHGNHIGRKHKLLVVEDIPPNSSQLSELMPHSIWNLGPKLREINFHKFRIVKIAIFDIFKGCGFWFWHILGYFIMPQIFLNSKSRDFELQGDPNQNLLF